MASLVSGIPSLSGIEI